jgi:hypothetical protein
MNPEFQIKLSQLRKPQLDRYEYEDGSVTVSVLTPESEKAWADYLRSITLAKITLNSEVQSRAFLVPIVLLMIKWYN